MRGCLRLTRRTLHQRRDKGGNAHNFPFDTLTKVYRDAVYVPQERYRGNPMYPERDTDRLPAGAAAAATPSPSSDVTNHVGNIGVMSPAATKLSDWMAEQRQQQHQRLHSHTDAHTAGQKSADAAHTHDDHQHHHHHVEGHSRATPISRGVASTQAKVLQQQQQPLPPTATAAGGDEALRQRLRTSLFAKRKRPSSSSGDSTAATSAAATATAAAPRHSGVQVEILNTYRSMLREVARMQDADTRRNLTMYIRQEYEKHRDVPRKNIMKIEWQLNYSKRKLEDLQAMGKHTKFTLMR